MNTWNPKTVLIVGGVAVAGLWYIKSRAGDTVARAGQAVNPTNPDNIFYGAVNSVGRELSGDEHFSLGGWIYDITHGGI